MDCDSVRHLVAVVVVAVALALISAAAVAQQSHVTDVVTPNPDGSFTYRYTVHNDTPEDPEIQHWIRDWELPYFAGAGITNIISPTNIAEWGDTWTYSIETIGVPNESTGWDGVAAWQIPGDPMYQGPNSPFTTATEVLHWYTSDACSEGCFDYIREGESLGGFAFTASFGPTNAPYQASWLLQPVRTGDPAFPMAGIPSSPELLQPGQAPEPATLALLGIGLAALGFSRRKRIAN